MSDVLDDAISLIGSRVALLAGPGVDNAFLGAVRRLIHSDDPFERLVAAMTDTGLSRIPELACAVTERGGVRLIVRGAGRAFVKTFDGASEVVNAKRVSTWTEHAVASVEELVLVVPNAAGSSTSMVLFLDAASQRRRRPTAEPAAASIAAPALAPMPEVLEGDTRAAPAPPAAPQVPLFTPPSVPPVPTFAAPDADDDLDLDHLLGDTRYRGAEAAAVRPLEEPAHAEEPVRFGDVSRFDEPAPLGIDIALDDDPDGDHDGNTISIAELRAVTTARMPTTGAAPAAPVDPPPAPIVGRLRFDDGLVVELDRTVLLGRQPRPAAEPTGSVAPPRLVSLADSEQSLSRTHAEIRVEGPTVAVLDLGSVNGTVVVLPGQGPQVLRAGEPVRLVPGARIVLADQLGCTFEGARG